MNYHFTIILGVSLVSMLSNSQIKGNGIYQEKVVQLKDIHVLSINIYSNIQIDASTQKRESLKLTAESNIIDEIRIEVEQGVLTIDQKRWIESSKPIIIDLVLPTLKYLIHTTHEALSIKNLDQSKLNIKASLGELKLNGTVTKLIIMNQNASIDATDLAVEEIDIDLNGNGILKFNTANKLRGSIKESGTIVYEEMPDVMSIKTHNGIIESVEEIEKVSNPQAKWIRIKIRNNSPNRHHFFVLGPKPYGRHFSYGFTLMPLASRKEHWTVGTEIYRVNDVGLKTLLKTIKLTDENRVVNLFND